MKHTESHKLNQEPIRPLIGVLYDRALPANRSGALFGAFPYPTKISPSTIALYIAAHTNPGDTVFDGFAGSGTTGLAALLCEHPSKEMRAEVERLGLDVRWGPRNAVLQELSILGAFVGQILTNPPEPKLFKKAADNILHQAQNDIDWVYKATDPSGEAGNIRHIIWTDILRCPKCKQKAAFWDGCVSLEPACISSEFCCPKCNQKTDLSKVNRVTENVIDKITKKSNRCRARKIARVYGITGKKRWSRPMTKEDSNLFSKIKKMPIPKCVPNVSIPWGDLYRSGYHSGITHLHHFYTHRNLIVFSYMWSLVDKNYEGHMRDALRFWLLSYNASHATIMSRVVAKKSQKDLVVTSAQPGVLYVSGLPVEKNLFIGLKRKLNTIFKAFSMVHKCTGEVEIRQGSSCKLDYQNESIDYVFTDPPFGGNIPYSEVNFLNEAWLRTHTDRAKEVTISSSQGKTIVQYKKLLTDALSEVKRILKPEGYTTLVFHSASAEVWNALQSAYTESGFFVHRAGELDKTQGSFKQITAPGSVRGDLVLLLEKRTVENQSVSECVWKTAARLLEESMQLDPSEQTPQKLYSRLIRELLENRQTVPFDANTFYRWYDTHYGLGANSYA